MCIPSKEETNSRKEEEKKSKKKIANPLNQKKQKRKGKKVELASNSHSDFVNDEKNKKIKNSKCPYGSVIKTLQKKSNNER